MTELIASSQTLTLRSSARFTAQDAELLTQHLPDNEQRFDQNGQVGQVLDQLLDAGLELYRSQEEWIDENNPVQVIDVFVVSSISARRFSNLRSSPERFYTTKTQSGH
jgi:hypothetical protein